MNELMQVKIIQWMVDNSGSHGNPHSLAQGAMRRFEIRATKDDFEGVPDWLYGLAVSVLSPSKLAAR